MSQVSRGIGCSFCYLLLHTSRWAFRTLKSAVESAPVMKQFEASSIDDEDGSAVITREIPCAVRPRCGSAGPWRSIDDAAANLELIVNRASWPDCIPQG